MSKSIELRCWENLPEVLRIADNTGLVEKAPYVYVTEDLVGDNVDIIVGDKLSIRVNGQARGEDYKYWSKFFKETYDVAHMKATLDFKPAVIRMIGVREPKFLKVWAAAHWDNMKEETRYVPWESLDRLCRLLRLDKMPQLFKGKADIRKFRELTRIPIIGTEKRGIFIIPGTRPIRYISRTNEVTSPGAVPGVARNEQLAKNLAMEVSRIALDPVTILQNGLKTIEDTCKHVHQAKEYLLLEYANRCAQEAGVSEAEGSKLIDNAIETRAKELLGS